MLKKVYQSILSNKSEIDALSVGLIFNASSIIVRSFSLFILLKLYEPNRILL